MPRSTIKRDSLSIAKSMRLSGNSAIIFTPTNITGFAHHLGLQWIVIVSVFISCLIFCFPCRPSCFHSTQHSRRYISLTISTYDYLNDRALTIIAFTSTVLSIEGSNLCASVKLAMTRGMPCACATHKCGHP